MSQCSGDAGVDGSDRPDVPARAPVDDVVIVLDELRLPSDQVDGWLTRWRSSYLPRARERGLHLRGVWSGWTSDPDFAVLVVSWSVARVGRYWAARWAATEDPTVREFWQWTDSVATARERRVLKNLGDEA